MDQVIQPSEHAHDLLSICQKLDTTGDGRVNGVIVLYNNVLHCFEVVGSAKYEAMTVQIRFAECPLRYDASEESFVHLCLPTMISKIGFSRAPRIAFIDADLSWPHERLLRDWVQHNSTRQTYSRLTSIAVDTYLVLNGEPLTPDTRVMWKPSAKSDSLHVTSSDTARVRLGVNKTIPQRVTNIIRLSRKAISVSTLEDVPAEFDEIVWKADGGVHPSSIGASKWQQEVKDGRCFSTMEMAQRIFNDAHWSNAVDIYRDLRRDEGTTVHVPMVGFKSSHLHAKGYLGSWSPTTDVLLGNVEFKRLRTLRYVSVELGNRTNIAAS